MEEKKGTPPWEGLQKVRKEDNPGLNGKGEAHPRRKRRQSSRICVAIWGKFVQWVRTGGSAGPKGGFGKLGVRNPRKHFGQKARFGASNPKSSRGIPAMDENTAFKEKRKVKTVGKNRHGEYAAMFIEKEYKKNKESYCQ